MTTPIRKRVNYADDPTQLARQVGELARDVEKRIDDATQLATRAVAGFMSPADKTKLDGVQPNAAPAILGFGANDITGAGIRFLFAWYSHQLAVATDSQQVPLTRGGTVRNLVVRQNSPGTPGTTTLTYTVLKNGAAQMLSVAMTATATQAGNFVNSFTVARADRLSMRVIRTGPPLISSPAGIVATMEFAA